MQLVLVLLAPYALVAFALLLVVVRPGSSKEIVAVLHAAAAPLRALRRGRSAAEDRPR